MNNYWYHIELSRLKQQIRNLELRIHQVQLFLMHRIELKDFKVTVVCDHCHKNGEVNIRCNKCGGKGIHNKTKQRWELSSHPINIVKIDRDNNGDIRYWVDMSTFYYESKRYLHFTEKEAKAECDKRNKELAEQI